MKFSDTYKKCRVIKEKFQKIKIKIKNINKVTNISYIMSLNDGIKHIAGKRVFFERKIANNMS